MTRTFTRNVVFSGRYTMYRQLDSAIQYRGESRKLSPTAPLTIVKSWKSSNIRDASMTNMSLSIRPSGLDKYGLLIVLQTIDRFISRLGTVSHIPPAPTVPSVLRSRLASG